MDEQTLAALKGSIAKWEAIVAGTGGDLGTENCPLCKRFNNEDLDYPDDHQFCDGCPVANRVREPGCSGTPYIEWCEVTPPTYPRQATTDEHRQIAQAEVDFLRSLLPQVAA